MLKHNAAVCHVAISPDGRTAVTECTNADVSVWDLETQKVFVLTWAPTGGLHFSPDGDKVLVVSRGGKAREWDWRKREPVGGRRGCFVAGVLSGDLRTFIKKCPDGELKVFSFETQECLGEFENPPEIIYAAVLSWDGRLAILSCPKFTVSVWDLKSGRKIQELPPHRNSVVAVAIALDGRTAVTATFWNGYVWDLRSPQIVQSFTLGESDITCMALSKDGNALIAGSRDCMAHLLNVTPSWKKEVWALLSTKRWDGEMGRELSDYL